jgi:hypothetical protein
LANLSKMVCCFSVTVTLAAFPGMAIFSERKRKRQFRSNRLFKQYQFVLAARVHPLTTALTRLNTFFRCALFYPILFHISLPLFKVYNGLFKGPLKHRLFDTYHALHTVGDDINSSNIDIAQVFALRILG